MKTKTTNLLNINYLQERKKKKKMKHFKKTTTLVIYLLYFLTTNAQQLFVPLNNEINFRIEKIKFNSPNFHSSIKPFQYSQVYESTNNDTNLIINKKNTFLNKLLNQNLIKLENKKNKFSINPILETSYNYLKRNNNNLSTKYGVSINGNYTKKLSLHIETFLGYENKTYSNNIPNDTINIIPHFGKTFKQTNNTFSFFNIDGYLSYTPIKFANFQVGKGKNFWGEGYRSLFLSDNSNSYPFIKTSINVWKFRYIWLVGALKDYNSDNNNFILKQKYMFSHYLSWNATKWLNINFFETIISNPIDSAGVNYFNINYLNPVIFFRPVEFSSGTADNALLGIGFKIKLLKKIHIYTQAVIDEFVFAEIKSNKNWWGNKYAIQTGIKLFNIKNLILLSEYNYIRPYTYSYANSIQNYGNHYQPLAHPSGANIKETIFLANYNYKRYSIQFKAIHSISGIDTDTISYGNNIYKSYTKRKDDYENYMLQGLKTEFIYFELSNNIIINPKYNISLFLNINNTIIKNKFENKKLFAIRFGIKSLLFNNKNDFSE